MANSNSEIVSPRVLLLSSFIDNAKEIANKINAKYLSRQGDLEHYLLDIDNKYYTAQILLCVTDNFGIDASNFEALIFHCDFQTEDDVKSLERNISSTLSQSETELVLIVTKSISNNSIREKVTEWCANKKFELIVLQLSNEEIMDLEEDKSNYGFARIIEVLETHAWPNIRMKDNKKFAQVPQSEVKKVESQLESVKLSNTENFSERLQMESILDGIMNNENADFGELFSHLRAMKEQAAQMPSNQRKVAATELVTAFWKAIGGDPSEIDDEDVD